MCTSIHSHFTDKETELYSGPFQVIQLVRIRGAGTGTQAV